MKWITTIASIMVLTFNLSAQVDTVLYSFFTAGHTYGNPNNDQLGLHEPFVDYIPKINEYPKMQLGFLTGDVVEKSIVPYWDSAQADISKINVPVHIAAGNHDMGAEFINRFKNYYYSFIHNNDLFIILTPGLDAWNISGAQLEFLTRTLESNYLNVNHIFIFLHELIWWSPTNEYSVVKINYVPHFPGSTNYSTVVKPLLMSYPNDITLYAGDLGAFSHVSSFMYDKTENITLIGSGMGGGTKDNIIITDVYKDSVHFKLVAINGSDSTALGDLEDYSILSNDKIVMNESINVYPNPANEFLSVENGFTDILNFDIFNISGQKVMTKLIGGNSTSTIDINRLIPGLYIVNLSGKRGTFRYKVMIN